MSDSRHIVSSSSALQIAKETDRKLSSNGARMGTQPSSDAGELSAHKQILQSLQQPSDIRFHNKKDTNHGTQNDIPNWLPGPKSNNTYSEQNNEAMRNLKKGCETYNGQEGQAKTQKMFQDDEQRRD